MIIYYLIDRIYFNFFLLSLLGHFIKKIQVTEFQLSAIALLEWETFSFKLTLPAWEDLDWINSLFFNF